MRVQITSALLSLFVAGAAFGQDGSSGPVDVYNAPSATPSSQQQTFSKEQIAQLVAPLALYPDSLLTQILMASTYPLEVVQADRFAKANASLQGDDLAKALEQQPWDPSVKSLVNFPKVLAMMSDQLDTTVQLGNAFLAQQQDVLAAVQDLRQRAEQAGNLRSNDQINVTTQPGDSQPNNATPDDYAGISIAPTGDNLSYIPDYDPTTIYGAWPYPNYLPYSYYPAGYGSGSLIWGNGIIYSVPWGYAWGVCDWHHRWIDYDFHRGERYNRIIDRDHYRERWDHYREVRQIRDDHWVHDARHRDGVPYPDPRDAARFGDRRFRDNRAFDQFRGRDGNIVESNRDRGHDDNRVDRDNRDNRADHDDRVITIPRNSTPNVPSRDSENRRDNNGGVTITRNRDNQEHVAQRDDSVRTPERVGPSVDRSNIGDVNRSQAEERAAAERGRASRGSETAPRYAAPGPRESVRSAPAPVRSEPAPVRSTPSAAPSAPRVATPSESPRVSTPSGGSSSGGGNVGGGRGRSR